MTTPQNPFATAKSQEELDAEREYVPLARCRNVLMIVRPLSYQRDGFVTMHKPEGTDAVFCDIATLDPIPAAINEYGDTLKGFEAGKEFRDQVVLQGCLKGTFKRHIGETLIGTVYFGQPTKGKPPIMWHDLSKDAGAVQRGQHFLATHPQFLVPTVATISEASAPQYGPPGGQYGPPAPTYQPPVPNSGYGPDPYRQPTSAPPVSPVSPVQNAAVVGIMAQTAAATAGEISTLDQMRQMAQNNPGFTDEPPF